MEAEDEDEGPPSLPTTSVAGEEEGPPPLPISPPPPIDGQGGTIGGEGQVEKEGEGREVTPFYDTVSNPPAQVLASS